MNNNTIYCSKCGKKHSMENNFCLECGEILRNNQLYSKGKTLDNFKTDFDLSHRKILEEETLTMDKYNTILKNIIEIGESHYDNKLTKTPLEKILKIANAYATCIYKSKGEELGSYEFNTIFIDDRLDESQQIATVIHELAHHLFAEILEQILMYVWEVKKSPALEAFVLFTLGAFENMAITNEYSAHTVEGRFIPHGYQSYGSFNRILEQSEIDKEIIIICLIFGNTIADDIIGILEEFIEPDLREEIKLQYKKDLNQPSYDQIAMEQKEVFDSEMKIELINTSLINGLNALLENPEVIDQLKESEEIFEIHPG